MKCNTRRGSSGNKLLLFSALFLHSFIATASKGNISDGAYSTIISSAIFLPTSDLSSDLSRGSEYKVLLQARDDAATFIASEGHHRGAFLEAAFRELKNRGMEQGDEELAFFILSETASTEFNNRTPTLAFTPEEQTYIDTAER